MSDLRIELETWDPEDTLDFLTASLAKAGNSGEVFDPNAASRVHELTQGVPRKVSNLAELALVAGAGQQLKSIDAATIDAVFEELAWILR
jgi:general secretion pathway protein A